MGTKKSGMIWSVMFIVLMLLVVPVSAGVVHGWLSEFTETTSFYDPNEISDMNNETFTNYDGDATFAYTNDTGSSITADQTVYYKSNTPSNYNEILLEQGSSDEGTVDTSKSCSVSFVMNKSVNDMIDKDLKKVELDLAFERNSSVEAKLIALADTSSEATSVISEGNDFNVTENLSTYSFDISYSKMLDADSDVGDKDDQRLVVKLYNSSGGAFQPADSVKFNVRLMHEETVSRNMLVETFNFALGIFVLFGAVMMTDKYDFTDLVPVNFEWGW